MASSKAAYYFDDASCQSSGGDTYQNALERTLDVVSGIFIFSRHILGSRYDYFFAVGENNQITDNTTATGHTPSPGKNYHKGLNIALPEGTEILAGQYGTVTFAGNNGDYALVVVLDDGEGLVSKYAHCSALLVSAGQTVQAGDVIARVGNTVLR